MAIPFARATRSLAADSFRYTLIALAVAILLLLAWGYWFTTASIRFYQTSEDVEIEDSGIVSALFAKEDSQVIVRGQHALFYPDGGIDGRITALAAVVTDVTHKQQSGQAQVQLVLLDERRRVVGPLTGATGRVEIELEQLSPLQLVIRNSGFIKK